MAPKGSKYNLFCGRLPRSARGATISMTEEDILARAAGITAGLKAHPKEVAEAVASARRMAGAFTRPVNETAEPMPAYAAPIPTKGSRA